MPITQTPIPLSDEWSTPPEVFGPLNEEFGFTLDASAKHWNAKTTRFFGPDESGGGLTLPWDSGIVWLNPPYSDIASWLKKAIVEADKGATVVCLLPLSPDRHWWRDCVEGVADEVRLLTRSNLRSGRVHFVKENGTSGRAPFASCVVVYRPRAG